MSHPYTPQDVAEGRALVTQGAAARLALGDLLLRIAPMNGHGGDRKSDHVPDAELDSVVAAFADDIGEAAWLVAKCRAVAHFYRDHRQAIAGLSWTMLREAKDLAKGDASRALVLIDQAKVDGVANVNRLRTGAGKRTADAGKVHTIVQQATPEEKVKLAADLLADPDVAEAVVQVPGVPSAIRGAGDRVAKKALADRGVKRRPDPGYEDEHGFYAAQGELFKLGDHYKALIKHLAGVTTPKFQESLREHFGRIAVLHDLADMATRGESVDDALARILQEESA